MILEHFLCHLALGYSGVDHVMKCRKTIGKLFVQVSDILMKW